MEIIQKIVLSVVAILAATDFSFAQTYSNVPNDTINMVGMMEDLETLSIQQLNTSSDTIQLAWAKVSESVPDLWEASVCDNKICYTSLVDSGSMNPIKPADYSFLLLHITPHVNYGTATIRYAVWDISTPTIIDTLTYILTVSATSGISKAESENTFSIVPNPAKENINIISKLQTGFHFIITDVTGKVIRTGNSNTNTITINTGYLANGVYSISIITGNKIVHTKKLLIQK